MSTDPVRLRRQIPLLVTLAIVLVTAVALPTRSRVPRVIYNASGSAPIGWYRVENRTPTRGDTAIIRPSATLESLLATHGLLPPGVPLLKRVAALGGDRICRSAGVVLVNDEALAEAFERDRNGRPLPHWEGCFTLFPGQFFLVQPHPYSLDSRYFGPLSECEIIGVATPLWTWNSPH